MSETPKDTSYEAQDVIDILCDAPLFKDLPPTPQQRIAEIILADPTKYVLTILRIVEEDLDTQKNIKLAEKQLNLAYLIALELIDSDYLSASIDNVLSATSTKTAEELRKMVLLIS